MVPRLRAATLLAVLAFPPFAPVAQGRERDDEPPESRKVVPELAGKDIQVEVRPDLGVVVRQADRRVWQSAPSQAPAVTVRSGAGPSRTLPLTGAADVAVSAFREGAYRGHSVRLGGFPGTDVVVELTFALDPAANELLVQARQAGGNDTVVEVNNLYRFEKLAAEGGYLVLPQGSGYLLPAECPDALPGKWDGRGGLIGARWSLPFFGIVRGDDALFALVETWWDCEVEAQHVPGDRSALAFHWRGSLGKLAYPRRFRLRFAKGMDYVAMAKSYREEAKKEGLLRTLREKAADMPAVPRYVENVLFRWPAWNAEDTPSVLADIRRLRGLGLGVNFFFPKWPSAVPPPGQALAAAADGGWQAYLREEPVPGGWKQLVDLANEAHRQGCLVQGFVNPRVQNPRGPDFSEDRWPRDDRGQPVKDLGSRDALARCQRLLNSLRERELKLDVLYFDGFSAHQPLPEDFTAEHPVTRRQNYDGQNRCFAETRRRGIMPGGELARFWCIPNCDYFFFTDWARDRLVNAPARGAPAPVGEPVPLFQLVFHDCYIAGFSGGGYSLYTPGYDWWADRTPRLYELLFASAPAHNWLPDGHVPVRDWESALARRRWDWLKRWSAYYQAVAMSEMVRHQFLSADHKRQRVEFANGVAAEFNFATDEWRVTGIPGFGQEWEKAPALAPR